MPPGARNGPVQANRRRVRYPGPAKRPQCCHIPPLLPVLPVPAVGAAQGPGRLTIMSARLPGGLPCGQVLCRPGQGAWVRCPVQAVLRLGAEQQPESGGSCGEDTPAALPFAEPWPEPGASCVTKAFRHRLGIPCPLWMPGRRRGSRSFGVGTLSGWCRTTGVRGDRDFCPCASHCRPGLLVGWNGQSAHSRSCGPREESKGDSARQ